MTQIAISAAYLAGLSDGSELECPFCNGKKKQEEGPYTSYLGKSNNGEKLRNALETGEGGSAGEKSNLHVYTKHKIDNYYTTHQDWQDLCDGNEAHHIIPGASMKNSDFEKWAKKGEHADSDVGYSVNGSRNGIILPSGSKQTEQDKFDVMKESGLQWHKGNHTAHYGGPNGTYSKNDKLDNDENEGKAITYSREAKNRCNLVGQETTNASNGGECLLKHPNDNCPLAQPEPKPKPPPYGIIKWINIESDDLRSRISGNPQGWCDFVSKPALRYALEISKSMAECSQYKPK